MATILVIVESPTKAKTLRKFLAGLPDKYLVESSVGHVRDLPHGADEIPAKYKGEKWASLGVKVDEDFEPLYVVRGDAKKRIADLKKQLKEVDLLLLATDEDREGEAISWHLLELLKPKVPFKRMVFHEITKSAVNDALAETRELDTSLVEAQETRRVLDRIYGYEVSPILWRKIKPKLSAGRVQSIAVRMVVERERDRMKFCSAEFWDLSATFSTGDGAFAAKLNNLDGKRIAAGRDFDPDTGQLTGDAKGKVALLSAEGAKDLESQLGSSNFVIQSADEKPVSRKPAAPFITSTLQQEGSRKLGFDAKRTMRAAQKLYENGFITYMRTDSVTLSDLAIEQTRARITEAFGPEFLPDKSRSYKSKVKNAQEAHEAIRPAGDPPPLPELVKSKLGGDEARLYELIWKRTLASQMSDAIGRRMTLRVSGKVEDNRELVFQATGTVWDKPGFLRAYVEGSDDPSTALSDKETILPPVKVGQPLGLDALSAEEHHTTPPARLTEASLVKYMEEEGIGRPSTYASIIDTIQYRGYVFKKSSALVPTFTAFAVVRLMETSVAELVDFKFTRELEDQLDAISRGEAERVPYLKSFYFGNGRPGLKQMLENVMENVDAKEINTIPLGVNEEGEIVVARVGKFGPYVQCDEQSASIPDGICPDELTVPIAMKLIADKALGDEPIGMDPESKLPVYLKSGRFGPYVRLGDQEEGSKEKPKMVSLLKDMKMEDVDLPLALRLLTLPRTLGVDENGDDVIARLGRYGPYITRLKDSRSLKDEDNLLEIELPRALVLLAEPRVARGRAQPKILHTYGELKELDGLELKILDGRYGPYVTDGEFNGSLPKDEADKPTEFSLARALDVLAAAKERKGRKKKSKKKATKKKATKKKVTKKKATKKKATKKKATKKKATSKKAASADGSEESGE